MYFSLAQKIDIANFTCNFFPTDEIVFIKLLVELSSFFSNLSRFITGKFSLQHVIQAYIEMPQFETDVTDVYGISDFRILFHRK